MFTPAPFPHLHPTRATEITVMAHTAPLSRRSLLAISAAALAGTASAAPLTQAGTAPPLSTLLNPSSDADLIAMVRDWMETWTRFTRLCREDEDAPGIPAVMQRLHELEERIARTRATTREGLLARPCGRIESSIG